MKRPTRKVSAPKRARSTPASKTKSPEPGLTTEANVTIELSFHAKKTHRDPFNDVVLDVLWIDPKGQQRRVPAFWAGGKTWKVRYASPLTGQHTFRTACSDKKDAGLHGVKGRIEVTPYTGDNPVYVRGPLHVSKNLRYLEHENGEPFFWLGDTWWMGLCSRLPMQDFQTLAADRKAKGFNVVQIIAGLYPDMPPFDPRGANENGFPWEDEYKRIRPEYFDAVDRKLGYLIEQGFTPCLVGAWGYFIPWMGVEKLKQHWRYLIGRYASWPLTWCVAGEANLPWYLAKNFPSDDRSQVHEWTKLIRYVRETDPFRRPLTIHPTAINRYTARNATEDSHLLDFDLLQTPHAQNEGVSVTVKTVRECYGDSPRMPVIDGEPCYEMLGGTITTQWPRRMFWLCMMNGAAGHTYGGNGIWQCNQPGKPHGPSPHGGDYGTITWRESMNLGGSKHIGFGKKFLSQLPWWRFRPHPEWASIPGDLWLPAGDAKWIWPDTAKPAKETANYRRYFRKTFTLPDRPITHARLRMLAGNHLEARINDAPASTSWGGYPGAQAETLASLLRPGANLLSIWTEHRPSTGTETGILARLQVRFADGSTQEIVTDDSWRTQDAEVKGWNESAFDDRGWKSAVVFGADGEAPRPKVEQPDPSIFGPQSTGMPGQRVVYVPLSAPVTVHALGAKTRYEAKRFDAVAGTTEDLGTITSDSKGNWTCDAPAFDNDWALLLVAKKR